MFRILLIALWWKLSSRFLFLVDRFHDSPPSPQCGVYCKCIIDTEFGLDIHVFVTKEVFVHDAWFYLGIFIKLG
jgi:hypothetical protein